ncbi:MULTISPECIES: hypothetical protein [unclassified Mucilaginibacter]|uniref:hypothetical protein n=1 Tax=unclassified Mucilaginibacter TaxID=2617802 RepID=UPI002AC8E026|nr:MULTISPECIES: hypothetical protein [unclassified Mucilaginibacter]MEB0262202.1 hypothetical protein [Mucilaginibacter sp. 10I4]MEB0277062.1 hypothetical protein [Mucilaginibacter sp. 10B2]MEB0302190.1 hypothetical protein [Mucilaginibacter sp. 5C4]WPX25163.1 hypothetical protein RHM67_07770 [Mucilaginibacter sp. 5C4]
MKFVDTITIDWYDNVLKCFCKDVNGTTYYCSVIALDKNGDQKIYLCVDIEYLKGHEELKSIIKMGSFKENWNLLSKLIRLKKINTIYLLKAKNIVTADIQLIPYKNNGSVPVKVFFGEYPYDLEEAGKMENWWSYFPE